MKKQILFFGLFWVCLTTLGQQPKGLLLHNSSSLSRIDEPIVLSRERVEKYMGTILTGKIPLVKKLSGEVLPAQTDDLNGDGIWDEFVFLASFQANEKYRVVVIWTDTAQLPVFAKRTQARLARLNAQAFVPLTQETMPENHKPTDFSTLTMPLYQTEGPIWENDKVGFRLYFDPRNGKDIFGKTTFEMVLQDVGLPGGNYHKKNDWGMDILKVGNSLGAGALALVFKDSIGQEKLIRLGGKVKQTSCTVISNGPIRSILRLTYRGWQTNTNELYDVTEEIRITAGQFAYESFVTLSGFTGDRQMAAGIVNLHSQKYLSFNNKKYAYLATHDHQTENQDKLGMAIMVPAAYCAGFGETPETAPGFVEQTYFARLKATAGKPVSFRFYACWEASDKRFTEAAFFENFLKTEITRLANPIKISHE
ncbi:MAG: DUF4861 domain-containing protein [Verrucomicrobia bacterium]|nr:DUF4861 domain-containing protein [Cytophagales bacterium]